METVGTTSEDKFDPRTPPKQSEIVLDSCRESDRKTRRKGSNGGWGFFINQINGTEKNTVLMNIQEELRATKAEMEKLKNENKAQISEIIGNPETADLFIALNAELRAAKKKIEGLDVENNRLQLRIARMEQAEAKKSFDCESSHAIAMKGGNVTNMELNNLTYTITELRGKVLKLTRDVAERDLKLQETWYARAESKAICGYQSMTVDGLRETLKMKERLVAELRTMKSEYHQEIKNMRKKIEILESELFERGRVENKGENIDKNTLMSLSAKNEALEKMLEKFMRTLKLIRHGDSFDQTVGGALHRTKISLELCSNLSTDTQQLKDLVIELSNQAKEIGGFITCLKVKNVTCKETTQYCNELLETFERLTCLLDSKVINDPTLQKDLREQLSSIPRPLRLVLVTLKNISFDTKIDYDLTLDNEDVQHLKAEMKLMHVNLTNLRSENIGLRKEVSLLESANKTSTDSVAYRLSLLRQQYKDRIVDLELSIEEVLKQAEDELSQAYLEVRQLRDAHSIERSDRTEELDAICALAEKLSVRLREKDEELSVTKTDYERRILVLMKNYEERITELEILNSELRDEVEALNDDLDFFHPKSDDDTKFSPPAKFRNGEFKIEKDPWKMSAIRDGEILSQQQYNFTLEEARNKVRYLENELKMGEERCKNSESLIMELRKRLKRQESEIAMESKIGMKMSEKMIDQLQKRIAEQNRKLEQIDKGEGLLSDCEKRVLDTEIAALHKDLRIKEMEIEEITLDSKYANERNKKEISRLISEKCTYSKLCKNLRRELAAERHQSTPDTPKDRQRRPRVDSKRQKDLIQKLKTRGNQAEETIKNLRKRVLTLTMNQESESDILLERLKNQRENYEKMMTQLRDKYETQICDLVKNHEERITKIRSSFEEKVKVSTEIGQSKIDQRLVMLRAWHAAYVKTLRSNHRCTINEILERFKKQIMQRDRIIALHDRSILETLPKFEEAKVDCNEVESNQQQALDALQDEIFRIEDDLSKEVSRTAENERRTRELEGAVSQLTRLFQTSEKRLNNTISMLEEQNEALKKQYEEDLVAIKLEKQASQKKKAAIIKRTRWPRRNNVTLILSLDHEKYLTVS